MVYDKCLTIGDSTNYKFNYNYKIVNLSIVLFLTNFENCSFSYVSHNSIRKKISIIFERLSCVNRQSFLSIKKSILVTSTIRFRYDQHSIHRSFVSARVQLSFQKALDVKHTRAKDL